MMSCWMSGWHRLNALRLKVVVAAAVVLVACVAASCVRPGLATYTSSPTSSPGSSRATPASSSRQPVSTATLETSLLAVSGGHLLSYGKPVTLVGVTRPSLESSCAGDGHFGASDYRAMRTWGANVVRLTLSSVFWLHRSGSCPTYQRTVATAVANARAAGLYVVLDLQWSDPGNIASVDSHGGMQCPMPDATHDLVFWKDLAAKFSADQGVLFELYSEPFGVPWPTWLHGGSVDIHCWDDYGQTFVALPAPYPAVGMRPLFQAVRAVAPRNVVLIGGLDWGYDLSGISSGFGIDGPNLVYSTHPWHRAGRQEGDWDRAFGRLSTSAPVIATEVGSYDCETAYLGALTLYLTAHHMSWIAYQWSPSGCAGQGLIVDWRGAPLAPTGRYIESQMRAAT